MVTVPTVFAVGARLIAGQLNQLVTAVVELQDKTTAARYNITRTGLTQANASYASYSGSWSTSSGYTSSGGGVTVPNAGVYAVTVHTLVTGGSWSGRVLNEIEAAGVVAARMNPDTASVAENQHTVSCVTAPLSAGDLIQPKFMQNSGASATVTVTLRIIWLGGS